MRIHKHNASSTIVFLFQHSIVIALLSLGARNYNSMAKSIHADEARSEMLNKIELGANGDQVINNSGKSILARGCDPVMAERAGEMLPPQLGNPKFITCTNDDDFLEKISNQGGQLKTATRV